MTIPPSLDSAITALETMVSTQMTVEFVKTRLLDEELKRKGNTTVEVRNTAAFYGKSHKGGRNQKGFSYECYNCGKNAIRKQIVVTKETSGKNREKKSIA